MKKFIIGFLGAISLASAYQQASNGDFNVQVDDVFQNHKHIYGLNFTVQNNGNKAQNVRIKYPLPLDGGKLYRFDRTLSHEIISGVTGNKEVYPLRGGMMNLAKDKRTGRYSLDIMFKQNPGVNKFSVVVGHYDDSDMNKSERKPSMTVVANPTSNPIQDNPLIRYYQPRARISEEAVHAPGDVFKISLIRGNAETIEEVDDFGKKSKKTVYDYNEWNPQNVYVDKAENKVAIKSIVDLHVDSYGTIKDTRMVVPELGELADYYGWNQSTFDGHMYYYGFSENRELMMGRCWANGVFNLYSYFYGNKNTREDAMTQDEMVFWSRTQVSEENDEVSLKNRILRGFGLGTSGGEDTRSLALLNHVMKNVNPVYHSGTTEPLTEQAVIDFISVKATSGPYKGKGRPLFISMQPGPDVGHVMLIDGVAEIVEMNNQTPKTTVNSDGSVSGEVGVGTKVFHMVNLDNFGSSGYVTAENILKRINSSYRGYITYDMPDENTVFTIGNVHVDSDEDKDGLVDFDEIERFATVYNDPDSDHDGVRDFYEIYSYVIRTPMYFDNADNKYLDPTSFYAVSFDPYDSKNDRRPELIENFDGDQIMRDGGEDKNANGIYEPELGETDPLTAENAEVDNSVKPFVPAEVMFYALGKMYMNDGSVCYMENYGLASGKYCDVASESVAKNYSSSIGARAKVRNVYAKGGVQMRSNSYVNRAIMYKVPVYDDFYKQASATLEDKNPIYPSERNWPFKNKFKTGVEKCDAGYENKIVRGNFTLEDGAKFRTLKVESGSVLTIDPGTMCVENLQLESGALVTFSNLDYSTELTVNSDFIWRAKFDISDNNWKTLAKHFALIYAENRQIYIDSKWAGTIYAPKASIVMAQTQESKTFYGKVLANNIHIHQNADLFEVTYDRNMPVLRKRAVKKESAEFAQAVSGGVKLLGLNRNEVKFKAEEPGEYEVMVIDPNARKVASFIVSDAQAGLNSVAWNSNGVAAGRYIVSIKHNGSISGLNVILR